jgi:hypothetical protein
MDRVLLSSLLAAVHLILLHPARATYPFVALQHEKQPCVRCSRNMFIVSCKMHSQDLEAFNFRGDDINSSNPQHSHSTYLAAPRSSVRRTHTSVRPRMGPVRRRQAGAATASSEFALEHRSERSGRLQQPRGICRWPCQLALCPAALLAASSLHRSIQRCANS